MSAVYTYPKRDKEKTYTIRNEYVDIVLFIYVIVSLFEQRFWEKQSILISMIYWINWFRNYFVSIRKYSKIPKLCAQLVYVSACLTFFGLRLRTLFTITFEKKKKFQCTINNFIAYLFILFLLLIVLIHLLLSNERFSYNWSLALCHLFIFILLLLCDAIQQVYLIDHVIK